MKSICAVGTVVGMLAGTAAADVTWSASSGTTPESVGWSYVGGTPPAVSGGELSLGPTSYSGVSYYSFDLAPLALDPAQGIALEIDVRIDAATYGNQSGFLRGGFEMYYENEAGAYAIAEMGESAVALRTANAGLSSPSAAIDTTSMIRTYRLDVVGTSAALSVDGSPLLSTTFGGATSLGTMYFGDVTVLGSSTAGVTGVRIIAVPSPATAGLLVAASAIGIRRRR